MDLRLGHDALTVVLLGLIVLTIGLPGLLLVTWRVTRPPFRNVSFRWLYLAWASLLVSSSVWTFARDPRFSLEEAGTDNYVRLAFLMLGILVISVIGARYRFAFLSELGAGALGFFFIFSLWGLASTLWSVSPAGTLIKSAEYCAMLLVFALAASLVNVTARSSRERPLALKSIFDFNWLLVFLLIVSVYVSVVVWPEHAILREYRDTSGLLGFSIEGTLPGLSANAVGQLGAVLGIVALTRMLLKPGSKMFYLPVFLLSLVTMILTQSRSPILAFFAAVAVVLLVSRRFELLILSGFLMGAAFLTQYSQLALEFLRRGQDDQGISELTGRVAYWQSSIEAVYDRPLGGYGANAGGRYILQDALGDEVSTVHSTWVEIVVDTGILGLVLFTAALCATWLWLFRLRPNAMGSPDTRLLWCESLGVLTVMCVRSVFAVDLVWSWYVLTLGVILVFINVMRRQGARETYRESAVPAQPVPANWGRRSGIRG